MAGALAGPFHPHLLRTCVARVLPGTSALKRSATIDDSGGQVQVTFSIGSSWKAGSSCAAVLSVKQTGDLDTSSEYTELYAGGTKIAKCDQSTMGWATPSACTSVDVTKHVSSSGSLVVVLDASSEVDSGMADDDAGADGAAVRADLELAVSCQTGDAMAAFTRTRAP